MTYFKNRKEVNDFFKDEMFKFIFRSDGILHFETLEPIKLGDDYFDFRVTFFDKKLKDFFCYSKFSNWLKSYQLFEVIKYETDNRENREVLFFQEYDGTI